jgi:N-methylhydantoinase A
MGRYRFGVDIGGTFTDIVLLDDAGPVHTRKVSSTPEDYGIGIVSGVTAMLAELGVAADDIDSVVHATTVATNTILEFRGARTALLTTAGFRDVLEMRRLRIPVLYDLQYAKPAPLVPRRLRFEIEERMGPQGQVWRPLDEASVRVAAESVKREGCDAVAIALLHAYANPAHEQRVAALVRETLGDGVFITCSSDILPEIREYERTSTAVVNAYIGPAVERYIETLVARLKSVGIGSRLQVMQSGGGIMPAAAAAQKPAYIVESGPAAGVIACARLARAAGYPNVISFDMGGTTAKAAIVENGEPAKTTEFEVGAGINLSSKLVKGGGYAIKLPFIDVSEIGAGGGSIVAIDESGSLRVGPRSAGAAPGPACYGLGGTEPTLTDSFVVLGYINPNHLAGGSLPLKAELAESTFVDHVARPLGMDTLEAAHGVFTLAAATMTRAAKAVSTYRGRDPRDFALVAFGGNGPLVASEIARSLQMSTVLVPPAPGVFSALGLLFSDIEREFLQTFFRRLNELDAADGEAAFARLEADARAALANEGHGGAAIQMRRFADIRYAGQAYELTVAVPPGPIDTAALAEAFHAEHERTYGYRSEADVVELVNAKVAAQIRVGGGRAQDAIRLKEPTATSVGTRAAYFGRQLGRIDTPVIARRDLAGGKRAGPLIVEEYDSTCLVPPGCAASLDGLGNIVIAIGDAA